MRGGWRNSTLGFTLLEMLLGLGLLGLITLALFTALRFGTHSWERAEAKSFQVVDLALVESLLRREIGKAFPLRVGLASENKVAFEGDQRGLKFFAPLPAHFSTGGLSLIEIRHEPADAANGGRRGVLVLRHTLQNGQETDLPQNEATMTSRLLDDIDSVSIDYFGRDSDQAQPTWKDSWDQSGRLPQLIRLRLAFSSGEREFVIPTQLGEEAGCSQASYQRVCGSRR